MDWNQIGIVAEMLGAATVVVTLLYLAFQIRQNTKSLNATAYKDITSAFRDILLISTVNPEIAKLDLKARSDPDTLTDVEWCN